PVHARIPQPAGDGRPLLALHRHRLGVPLPPALPGGHPQMSTTATAPAHAHHHGQPHLTLRAYLTVYAALLGLMLLTLFAALFDLGPANFLVAMGIAVTKMVLIILYFMHVRFSDKLTWVFSTAAFLWLVILIIGFLNDYFTRGTIADK